MKKITFGMLIITFLMFLGLLATSDVSFANIISSSEKERDVYLNIMTCNKMQYSMVKDIVKDKHNIEYLFNNESNSNEFKVSQDTVGYISSMDLFFYTGLSYEKWGNDLINKLNKNNLGIIDLSRGIREINSDEDYINPYYLTGVSEYKTALYNIKCAIQDKDPINREYYEDNYSEAIKKLDTTLYIITKNIDKSSFNDYTFIAVDKNMEYFYRNLDINIKYVEENQLKKYIRENKIPNDKLIILKDSKTPFKKDNYNIIEFSRYDANDAEDMIIKNYKNLYYSGIVN